MRQMSPEIVPGMAEAIEKRRIELQLSPGDFAAAAGLTRQGAGNVRRGVRRQYQDKVKIGVARALKWRADAIDRLLDGEQPVPLEPGPAEPADRDAVFEALERLQAELDMLREKVTKLEADAAEASRPGHSAD
jgi:hypothetical protein